MPKCKQFPDCPITAPHYHDTYGSRVCRDCGRPTHGERLCGECRRVPGWKKKYNPTKGKMEFEENL